MPRLEDEAELEDGVLLLATRPLMTSITTTKEALDLNTTLMMTSITTMTSQSTLNTRRNSEENGQGKSLKSMVLAKIHRMLTSIRTTSRLKTTLSISTVIKSKCFLKKKLKQAKQSCTRKYKAPSTEEVEAIDLTLEVYVELLKLEPQAEIILKQATPKD